MSAQGMTAAVTVDEDGAEREAPDSDGGSLLQALRQFVEQQLLCLPRLSSLPPPPLSASVSQPPTSAAAPSASQLSAVEAVGAELLVDAFDLFYPTWRQRLARLQSLLASVERPLSSHLLSLLAGRYQAAYLGLRPFLTPPQPDLSLLSPRTQSTVALLVERVSDRDAANVPASIEGGRDARGLSVGGRAREQHVGTHVLLAYQAQLLQLLTATREALSQATADGERKAEAVEAGEAAESTVGELHRRRFEEAARLQRRSKAANSAYIRLCHLTLSRALQLLARYEEEKRRAEAARRRDGGGAEAAAAACDAAEEVLALFSQSAIGQLTPWLILSLPDLQVSEAPHAELTALLSSILSLLCQLSSLTQQSLQLSRPAPPSAAQPSSINVRLSNTRAKIAQLRHSQLLLLSTPPRASSTSSSPSPSAASPPSSSSSGAFPRRRRRLPPIRLHPFAVDVFSCIFYEFVTPSSYSAAGVAAMNRQDFLLFLKRRGSLTTEQAIAKSNAVFARYGAPPVAFAAPALSEASQASIPSSSSASSSLFSLAQVGDESSHLLLDGFLAFISDSAVESPRRVLKELRFLESRHSFNSSHHPSLLLLTDLKVAFAALLQSLFGADGKRGEKAKVLPSPHGLLTRTLEEEVNVRVGVPATLRGAATVGGGSGGGDVSIDPSAVSKWMNSHERWRGQQRRREKLHFLLSFVEHKAISIPSHFPSVASFALLSRADDSGADDGRSAVTRSEGPDSSDDAFSDAHSAARLSELFQRCMREMGGGYGHQALSSASSVASSVVDSFYVEKAYAAAVMKHNGLVDACIHYGRSLELWRLLANAATKGTRCLYQSSCPDWWRRVIQSVMDHVRAPISLLIREKREREEEQRRKDEEERTREDYERRQERERERQQQRSAVYHMRRDQEKRRQGQAQAVAAPTAAVGGAFQGSGGQGSTGAASIASRDAASQSSAEEVVGLDVIDDGDRERERERERAERSAKAGQDTSTSASAGSSSASNSPQSTLPSIPQSPSSSASSLFPDSPLVHSPVLGPSLGGLELDGLDSSDSLDPSVLRAMDLMAANALFLLYDLRGGATASSQAGSRASSKVSSPRLKGRAAERRRSEGSDDAGLKVTVEDAVEGWGTARASPPPPSSLQLSFDAERDGAGDDGGHGRSEFDEAGEDDDDGDEDEEDEEEKADRDRWLLLKRTQSDRVGGSPMRLSASPNRPSPPPLHSTSPSTHSRQSLSPPPLLMSAYGRRASESDAAQSLGPSSAAASDGEAGVSSASRQSAASFSATTSVLSSLPPSSASLRDVNALSSWTGASLDPLYTGAASSLLSEASMAPPASSFDDSWIASLIRCPTSLTSSLSSSVRSLQTALLSRVDLLQLLNGAFRSGRTSQLVDDVLPLIHSAHVVADIQTSSSLRSRNPSTEDGLLFFYKHLGQTLSRQRFVHGDREVWLRLRCVLLFFSVRFCDDDADLILGSGMLSVLARFIQRAERALAQGTGGVHLSAGGAPLVRERSVSATDPSSAAASGGAPFDEDERAAMFRYKTWAWQVFLHLTSFLLAQPASTKSKHHRYLLASTVGQQLTIQLQHALSKLRRYADHDGPRDDEVDATQRATVDDEELQPPACAFDSLTFPLQHHNRLYALAQSVEELIYRAVDMLNVLTKIAQQHSVCSVDHVLFLLRCLRSQPASTLFCPLPSIVQRSVVQLLRVELPHHSPHAMSASLQVSDVRLEEEVLASLSSMLLEGQLVAGLQKERRERERRKREEDSRRADRRGGEAREEKEKGDVGPAKERSTPSAASKDRGDWKERGGGGDGGGGRISASASAPPSPSLSASRSTPVTASASVSVGTSARAPSVAVDSSHSPPSLASPSSSPPAAPPLSSSLDLSSLPSPHSPSAAKKPSTFRRIAALICPHCRYVEFLACPYHRCYLTREFALSTAKGLSTAIAACADADCDVSTLTCTSWQTCRHCHQPHTPTTLPLGSSGGSGGVGGGGGSGGASTSSQGSLHFFHLSEREASYCSEAIKCNAVSVLRHNLFFCNRCRVAEFPGTKHGGLTLNIEGYLYDLPTRRFLLPSAYQFTHLTAKCQGEVELLSVRLSKEEAAFLGRLTKKTQPIDPGRAQEVEPLPVPSSSPSPSSTSALPPSLSLPPPWGYSSWQVSPETRSAVFAEMLAVVRLLLNAGRKVASDEALPAPGQLALQGASSSFSVQTSPSHSRAVSISNSPRSDRRGGERLAPSIRLQWREALYSRLRSFLLQTTSVCAQLQAQPSDAASSPASYLSSLLSLLVLGGDESELYLGSHVSFRADGQQLRGLVRRFDPSVATVSVSVARGLTGASSDGGAGQVGLLSAAQPTVELAVDDVTAEAEVAPPSLVGLDLVTDVVHVGQKLLTLRCEGALASFLLSRLQLALVHLLFAQLPALSSSSSCALTASAPLTSLLPPLLTLARSTQSLYPLTANHLVHSFRATRRELFHRLSALLPSSRSSHSAFLAAVRPPRSDDGGLPSLPPHATSRSSSVSSSPLILPRPDSPAEAPAMPVILMHLAQLTEMGFSSIAARYALAQSRGDVNMATNAIVTEHIYEDGDIDENAAMERWEQLLDRLNVRQEVEAWNSFAQHPQSAAGGGGGTTSASDQKDNGAAAAGGGGFSGRSGGSSAAASAAESEGERERRLLSVSSNVYLAHRFLWPNEEPEQPDPSSLPLSSPSLTSTPLTSNPLPYHADPAFSLHRLLHLLLSNTLLHTQVVITEEAASVYNKPPAHSRKGYKVGDKLHIVDLVNKVCPAEVVEVNSSGSKIYIHYSGWSKKWSEAAHTHRPLTHASTTPAHRLHAWRALAHLHRSTVSLCAVQGRVGGGGQ